jgi:hypothetical protein
LEHTNHTTSFSIQDWKDHLHTHSEDDPVLGHDDKLGGKVSCDDIVDEWHKWSFRIPGSIHPNIISPANAYGGENLTSAIINPVNVGGFKIFMVAFQPFKKLEDNFFTLRIYEKDSYILIPVLTAEACTEEYPQLTTDEKLVEHVRSESESATKLELKIDGIQRIGCHVKRYEKLVIDGVKRDNLMGIRPERLKPNDTIEIMHDGFFALVDVNKLGPGDHLISVIGEGTTYLNAINISINLLI